MKHGFLDKYSDLKSPIHDLDPRPKVLFALGFVFTVAWFPVGLWPLYGIALLIVSLEILISKVPLRYVLLRGAAVLPFSLIIGSMKLLIEGGTALPFVLSLSAKAWLSAVALLVLVATTPFPVLLRGIEALGFPRVLVQVLAFMYRYVFVILDETMKMKRAWDSRGGGTKWWISFKAMANIVGVLFIRSYERAERVYQAMCSRGFDGRMRTMSPLRFGLLEVAFSCISGISIGAIWTFWSLWS